MLFANLLAVITILAAATPAALAGLVSHYPPYKKGDPKARIINSCTKPNTVALTFDDGPYKYIHKISQELERVGAKGTFFFNGDNYDCIYSEESMERVKYVYDKGHQVASHTWAHKDLTTLNWEQIQDEMWRTEQALLRILGVIPAFMRPPYGNYNDLVRQAAATRNQVVAIWDFDSLDSDGASWQKSNQLYDQIIKKRPNTILALNHETYAPTAEHVVPHAIKALKNAGYELVTLAECVGMEPYQSVAKAQQPSPSWKC